MVNAPPGTAAELVAATRHSVLAQGATLYEVGSAETPSLTEVARMIDWSGRPWLLLIEPGDTISEGAIAAYRRAISSADARIIYADDDLDNGRQRYAPHFKPNWNAELFAHFDYVSGACAVHANRSDLEAVAECSDWKTRLIIGMISSGVPLHLPQMLHHRRFRPMPRLPLPPLTTGAMLPTLSVVIPTRNRVGLLRACIEGVFASGYPALEIIVVDNDSDDPETLDYLASLTGSCRVLRHGGAFNYSAINNRAAEEAQGRLLCLLNNDVEAIEPGWLTTLAIQALRPEVGAVGARLLYPDGRIQHAGVVIGIADAAAHAHRFLRPQDAGYFHRHNLPQFVTAVTGACMVVEREKFLAVGGLNQTDFPVAFNDVDLCIRLNGWGWQSLYEPRATLVHHESASRGFDRDPAGAARFARELASLKLLCGTDRVVDPYHHPELSRQSEQFMVAI
ncbi:glycosyltransferase family 2 protein [Sphingomonas sp. GlSt437]|uniref:glycosyltransferase family 2 protein n=1 Tax=Sphingomonas sp. GlSt437 TaxID=3389970 RepID=UPI003EC0FF48